MLNAAAKFYVLINLFAIKYSLSQIASKFFFSKLIQKKKKLPFLLLLQLIQTLIDYMMIYLGGKILPI